MMVLLKSYIGLLKKCVIFFYWQYRWLNNAKTGKHGSIEIPLLFEGKGKLITGNFFKICKGVELKIGTNAVFTTGKNLLIGVSTYVGLADEASFTVGDDFSVTQHSQIHLNGSVNWVWGNGVMINSYCHISSREPGYYGNLMIGEGSEIGDNSIVDVSADIRIGNHVSIGPNCVIYTHNHVYTNKEVAAWKGGVVAKPVVIEDGAWIASGVTILPGITIGKNTVVAAGSVVTKDLQAFSVYGGVPAKFIKKIEN